MFFHDGFAIGFSRIFGSKQNVDDDGSVAMSVVCDFVSFAKSFVHSSTATDQGYDSFVELARFIYCLLQKVKKSSSLPLVEQWDEYVLPNHSQFPAIDEKDFPSRTRVKAALDKVGSQYLGTEFRRDACCFSKSL